MGRVIAGLVVIVILAGGWMYFTDVDINDGEVTFQGPEVTRTEDKTVEFDIPTYDVDAPEDDANGEENEIIDDDGINAPDNDEDDVTEPDEK